MSVLEVNECRVNATGQGSGWWHAWRGRMEPAGRITVVTASLGGDLLHVACDSREDAVWLRGHMVSAGVPASAVRVKRSTS
jgi:hypothetical protein